MLSLFLMVDPIPCAEGVHRGSANIFHLRIVHLFLLHESVDVELRELESSLVHALLLHPDNLVWVSIEHVISNIIHGEWSDLLHSHYSN